MMEASDWIAVLSLSTLLLSLVLQILHIIHKDRTR